MKRFDYTDDGMCQCDDGDYVLHADTQAALAAARDAALEEAALLVINFTRIPDDAIRRGTGVRDRIVIEGEQMAAAIHQLKPNSTKGSK